MAAETGAKDEVTLDTQEQAKPASPFPTNFESNENHDNPSSNESPSALSPNAEAKGCKPDFTFLNYFISLDSTIENLHEKTQQLVEKINENRKRDHALMNSFRETLLKKVSDMTEKLEERVLLPIYDNHSNLIQDKLQQLSETMGRINQIETDLKQVCHSVEILYKDFCTEAKF